jgi:hypothetical protein
MKSERLSEAIRARSTNGKSQKPGRAREKPGEADQTDFATHLDVRKSQR